MVTIDEKTKFLVRRRDLLNKIKNEPATRSELRSALEPSKATIDRGLRKAREMGLVNYVDGEFQLTVYGRLTLEAFNHHFERQELLLRIEPLIQNLSDQNPLKWDVLEGSKIERTDPALPNETNDKVVFALENGRNVSAAINRGLTQDVKSTISEMLNVKHRSVLFIFADEVVEAMKDSDPGWFESIENSNNCEILIKYDAEPWSIWFIDKEEVVLQFYSTYGLKGTLINDSRQAKLWTEQLLEQMQDRCRCLNDMS